MAGQNLELNLIQTIYDQIYNIVTYSPGSGKAPVFDAKTTFIAVTGPTSQPINPTDFANAVTPTNVNGSLTASESFAGLIDPVPAVSAAYAPTTNSVDKIYGSIVQYGNTTEEPSEQQLTIYNKAYAFLNKTIEVTDFMGNKTTQTGPTPIYAAYLNNRQAYLTALSAYRTAYAGYNLTDPVQQRQWQANAPVLQGAVDNAWNTWRSQGATQVEEALAAMDHSINSAVRRILQQDQNTYTQSALTSNLGGTSWHLSYALPGSWYDASCPGFTSLKISTANLNESADSSFTKYGGGTSFGAGLWSFGASAGHQETKQNSHMDATNIQISFDIGLVELFRPWLDGQVFNMSGWNMGTAYEQGTISTGNLDTAVTQKAAMPLLPVGMVVARNISITGNWSSQDKSLIEQATSGGTSIGWGPFQLSGSYAHSSSSSTFKSQLQGSTITVPGIQIVAWINQIVPLCPPN